MHYAPNGAWQRFEIWLQLVDRVVELDLGNCAQRDGVLVVCCAGDHEVLWDLHLDDN